MITPVINTSDVKLSDDPREFIMARQPGSPSARIVAALEDYRSSVFYDETIFPIAVKGV